MGNIMSYLFRTNSIGVIATTLVFLFGGYVVGLNKAIEESPSSKYWRTYSLLVEKKKELNREMDNYANLLPALKEPFLSQYKDSLENKIIELHKLNPELVEAKQKYEEFPHPPSSVFLSWWYSPNDIDSVK